MSRRMTDFLVVTLVIAAFHPVAAQLLDPLEHFAESHVLWDFVPPKKFFSLCMTVGDDVGENSADPRVCQSSCEKHVAQFKDPEAKLHCKYMAMQMEIATIQEVYHGPYDFCKNMLMYQSSNLKTDVLEYVTKDQLWDACTQSIINAMDSGVGMSQEEAIQQNLPLGCKSAVENLYREHGMPIPSATMACKGFVEKAEVALSAQELTPADQGKQFCDGNSMQAVAFKKSAPSEAPPNFPLSLSDWSPKVTLAMFQGMVREAYPNAMDAFTAYDADKDGNLDEKEWLKMGRDLGIPTPDIHILSGMLDQDKNNEISKEEWQKVMGATLPELVKYSTKKHNNAENGWKAADQDGDGNLTPDEFEAYCEGLGVPAENAKKLFPEVDKDGNGSISQEEYKNIFGIGVPELKRRTREKFGGPKDSFKAFDANGDGKIEPKEFEKACKDMNIPKATAEKLLGKIDGDKSLAIDPKEWDKAMGMTSEDAKEAIAKKFGANPMALDKNGDGQVSPEEVTAGLEESGASPEEAAKLLKDMDTDGDGKVSPEEIHEGVGGADMDEARGFAHPAVESGAAITLPEFKERAKKKHGSPQTAFDAFDASPKDGKISPQEFAAGAQALEPPVSAEVAAELFKALDKNGDAGVEPREWFEAMGGKESFGVTLPEFKERAKARYGSPQAAYDAMDTNPKDGKVTPEEFEAGCAQLEPPISAEEAKTLFAKLDVKPTDSALTPEEFFGAIGGPSKFGLTVPEFKERAAKKSGLPQKAYQAMDQNGDGKVAPEEFEIYCQSLAPPVSPEESTPLFKELDKNGSGFIEPEEFFEEVGKEAFSGGAGVSGPGSEGIAPEKGQIGDADGDGKISPAEKLAKTRALDLDGDGKVSTEEMGAAAAAGKLSPEEMKTLDTDGDGKLSKDELQQGAAATSASAEDQKKVMDGNGDGKISPDEIAAAAAKGQLSKAEVRKMDTDGDGKLSPAELKQGAEAAETAAAAASPKEKMKKALKGKFKSPKEAMKAMDTDGDGKISPAEMKKGLQEQGVSPAEAEKMMKAMDKDGDGKASPEELYAATGSPDEFTKSPGEKGYVAPREAQESPVSIPEFVRRLGQAYKNGQVAWDKMAGPGAKTMSCEVFKKKVENLGISPGQADKLCKEIDANGDGQIDEVEWQNIVGVAPDEVQDRFVDSFKDSDAAMKAADKDGDGKVSEAELEEVMTKKLGLTPANAKKAAKDMMKKLDPRGTGKIKGSAFKDATKAKADDLANRVADKMGSAADAMKQWDKDGDGKLTEAEFEAGAAELGISADAAKDMWKAQDKDGDGIMGTDDFSRAFGVGPDAVMEYCFQTFGNPSKTFDTMDTDKDGLLSPAEWKTGATQMGLAPADIDRIFKDMDTNHGENTPSHISKWEFYQYMDYEDPLFREWGDGFGELDAFGTAHKKFNNLPHTPKAAVATEPAAPPKAFVNSHRLPPMKWQVKKASKGLRPHEKESKEHVQKFLHDTAEGKEAAVSNQAAVKFMSPKDVQQEHNVAVHRHPLKENPSKGKKAKGGKNGKQHHGKKAS